MIILQLIPDCIQASTSIGIGMITALAGATELNIVLVRGKYTIVDMGPLTTEVIYLYIHDCNYMSSTFNLEKLRMSFVKLIFYSGCCWYCGINDTITYFKLRSFLKAIYRTIVLLQAVDDIHFRYCLSFSIRCICDCNHQ